MAPPAVDTLSVDWFDHLPPAYSGTHRPGPATQARRQRRDTRAHAAKRAHGAPRQGRGTRRRAYGRGGTGGGRRRVEG